MVSCVYTVNVYDGPMDVYLLILRGLKPMKIIRKFLI